MCWPTSPTVVRGTARRCSPASMRTSRSSSKKQERGRERRGAIAVAVTAMRRAAELSEPASRSRRLLAAAGLAVELGRSDVVVPLLREVNQLDLGELERARVTWVEEIALTRPLGDVAVHVTDRRSGTSRSSGQTTTCTSICSGSSPHALGGSIQAPKRDRL